MGMRRLFIIRKDLHLSAGKLGAMVAHCAEGYWISLIRKNITEQDSKIHASFDIEREIYDDYLNGRITKTICEARNLNMINDACLTELTPEWVDENGEGRCTVGIWFKPLKDEVAHDISRKYQLYRD